MYEITRHLGFDYGHRVLGHEGKCNNLHGHRGGVEVSCQALGLDSIGRVIDFGKVKELVGTWIDSTLDHNMILHPEDPLVKLYYDNDKENDPIFGMKAPFVMPVDFPSPTAENLARLVFEKATKLLRPHGIAVSNIRFWETPNCCADYGRHGRA